MAAPYAVHSVQQVQGRVDVQSKYCAQAPPVPTRAGALIHHHPFAPRELHYHGSTPVHFLLVLVVLQLPTNTKTHE